MTVYAGKPGLRNQVLSVSKEVVVTVSEEIVVRKKAVERVETTHDAVRRTEVNVDENPSSIRPASWPGRKQLSAGRCG